MTSFTPRERVYQAIDTERDYQDSLDLSRTDGRRHTVGEYITMLHHYMRELDEAWTLNPGDEAALNTMRKIAGISVRCMEDHGVVDR